jgi:hypothetical protein
MSIRQAYWIMLFREPIDLHCEDHTKHAYIGTGHRLIQALYMLKFVSLRWACLKPFGSPKGAFLDLCWNLFFTAVVAVRTKHVYLAIGP